MDVSRILLMLLVLTTSSVVGVGCGDDDDGDGGGDAVEATTTEAGVSEGPGVPSIEGSRTIELPGDTVFPEGIALDESGSRMFVTSTSDGTVFAGPVDGDALEPLQVDEGGPTASVGIATGPDGALWVAGGDTGTVWHLGQDGGAVLGAHKAPGGGATFINDVAVADDGTAYFTDSMRPVIHRVRPDAADDAPLERFLDLSTGPIDYVDGFNLNGIELSPDEEYLFVVQSNTGQLFRIPVDGGAPVEVDLGGETLEGGDGLELDDRRMYVVLGDAAELAVVDLDEEFASGELVAKLTNETFARPTTIATEGNFAYVVNSQFDRMDSPELPFTVSALELGSE